MAKADTLYLVFFITHIPVMLCIDLVPLYPIVVVPKALVDLRQYYIATYQDRLFTNPPAWFNVYIALEALYHLPLSFWAIRAIPRNDPQVPLQLLIFGLETAITTLTCMAEMLSWKDHTGEQKIQLCCLYGSYLLLAVFMSVDMIGRLSGIIKSSIKSKAA